MHEWIRFPDSGFVCLRDPSGSSATPSAQLEHGPAYIASYQTKLRVKFRRSLARARYLRRRVQGDTLLDVGSNIGMFVEAAHREGFKAVGVEPESSLVDYAKSRYPEYQFHNCLLEEFSAEALYSAIYCSEVIEHCEDPRRFGMALYDLLEPGGKLLLTTPDIQEYMCNGQVVRDLGAPDHKLYFDRRNIVPFLTSVGFRDIRHKFSPRRRGIRVLATR